MIIQITSEFLIKIINFYKFSSTSNFKLHIPPIKNPLAIYIIIQVTSIQHNNLKHNNQLLLCFKLLSMLSYQKIYTLVVYLNIFHTHSSKKYNYYSSQIFSIHIYSKIYIPSKNAYSANQSCTIQLCARDHPSVPKKMRNNVR